MEPKANLGTPCKEKSCMQGPTVTEKRKSKNIVYVIVQEREERIFVLTNMNVGPILDRKLCYTLEIFLLSYHSICGSHISTR